MLKDKVAIITGGTRGIGLETAKVFLENNAKVAILGSKEETVNKAIKELLEINNNYQVIGFHPNLTNESELKETFQKIKEHFGNIDILVNNAGLSSSTPLTSYKEEELNKLIDINIKGVFLSSKNIVPFLEEKGGVILNTSSMVSIYGQPSVSLYPTSKFAVNGLT